MTTVAVTTLADLQDDYTYRVNLLLDEGRDDLAAKLADQCLDDAAVALVSPRN